MRHLLTLLAALLICSVPLHAQTIRTLGYNTTNSQVLVATNLLTFTNELVLPSDATHSGLTELALRIGASNTGFYVSTSAGNPMVAAHNSSAAFALTTNVIIFYKPLRYNSTTTGSTNAPANTTNVVTWLEVQIGTNSYRVPLYQ
jgi:hypothetical protein